MTDQRTDADDTPEQVESAQVRDAHPLARFFFLKTTFGILLTLILTLGGVMAYFSLVKESLPDLDIPQATISTAWPGADPQTMEEQVTQELEDELLTLRGVKTINSASFDSYSLINSTGKSSSLTPYRSTGLSRSGSSASPAKTGQSHQIDVKPGSSRQRIRRFCWPSSLPRVRLWLHWKTEVPPKPADPRHFQSAGRPQAKICLQVGLFGAA